MADIPDHDTEIAQFTAITSAPNRQVHILAFERREVGANTWHRPDSFSPPMIGTSKAQLQTTTPLKTILSKNLQMIQTTWTKMNQDSHMSLNRKSVLAADWVKALQIPSQCLCLPPPALHSRKTPHLPRRSLPH
jgi:hypothetical protein